MAYSSCRAEFAFQLSLVIQCLVSSLTSRQARASWDGPKSRHLEERDLISAANTGGFDCRATRIWGKEEIFNALVFGLQGYHITDMQQGLGDATADPYFTYINPNNLEGSDYTMPNTQIDLHRAYSIYLKTFNHAWIALLQTHALTDGIE